MEPTTDLQNSNQEVNDEHVTDFLDKIHINASAGSRISF